MSDKVSVRGIAVKVMYDAYAGYKGIYGGSNPPGTSLKK
jgi:hypothetical protein